MDAELCEVIAQVAAGQADDPGGDVFKKWLPDNDYRSIILAKQDRGNINAMELKSIR